MIAGEPYDPADAQIAADRVAARGLCDRLAATPIGDAAARQRLLAQLLGRDTDAVVTVPFHCDYGYNIHLGRKVYFNVDCVVLDVAPVRIGDHTLFGPAVQIYTALHPMEAAERRRGLESAAPVTIGADVWVGGGAIICPGVTIGDGAVIGAGSVVTRDVPAGMFAAGSPARVLRAAAATTMENPQAMNRIDTVAAWHRVLADKNPDGLDRLLADDAVFHSPVVHRPQVGKALTKAYLSAAFGVFGDPSFRYVRQIVGERDALLEFELQIDGIHINGVDLIRWNDAGRIVDFKVMLRPLKAVNLVHQHMAAMLQAQAANPKA